MDDRKRRFKVSTVKLPCYLPSDLYLASLCTSASLFLPAVGLSQLDFLDVVASFRVWRLRGVPGYTFSISATSPTQKTGVRPEDLLGLGHILINME